MEQNRWHSTQTQAEGVKPPQNLKRVFYGGNENGRTEERKNVESL